MYKIANKEFLNEETVCIQIQAPEIAVKRKPGQFVMVRIDEPGERIPLTIAEANISKGTISLIFQVVGDTTLAMSKLKVGESLLDVVGPLGNPTQIENFGRVVCIGGGLGIALIYPLVRAFSHAGNKIVSILSARTKSLLILKEEIQSLSEEVKIATDDGSFGFKGFPTEILKKIIEEGQHIDLVVVVGPIPLMKAVAEITRSYKIRTIASLNSLMVDGTGMCGGCRVQVAGKMRFTCVDGPEFDAHQVDFDGLIKRTQIYAEEEKQGKRRVFSSEHSCKVDLVQSETHPQDPQKRQLIPELSAEERRESFREVALGYGQEEALKEAARCLQCKKPLCVDGCPVSIDIPAFIQLIKDKDPTAAAKKIKETSCLGAVCGRVCPAEDQCEKKCILGIKGEPVAIGNLERFATDMERKAGKIDSPKPNVSKGKKVAIVGSGPAGITVAGDLARKGYEVTIFEAFHKPGGVLVYGIPDFRLPNSIVEAELEYLRSLGVKIRLNAVIGKLYTVDDLLGQGFSAVFIGTGAGLPRFMGIPGENLNGVFSANEYLARVNLMKAYDVDYKTPIPLRKKVVVIGGGNVAMDAARIAIRLGAEVTLVYRRSREEMPVRPIELDHAEAEGLQVKFLINPVRIIGGPDGWVSALECMRMELGPPDESGRKRPIPIKGSEFILDTDMVIEAIGAGPNPVLLTTTPNLNLNKRGYIKIDEEACSTSKQGVYAGGDIVSGSATVILAMGAGRRAARAMDKSLSE